MGSVQKNLSELLPGRLGDAGQGLLTDPRLDPRIKAALELAPAFGAEPGQISADADYAAALEYCAAFEAASAAAHPLMEAAMPAFEDVDSRVEEIDGTDGNTITLYIDRPRNSQGSLPCIVHTHGGGMVLMAATDPSFVRWRKTLAALGCVVVGVEFRNGGGKLGNHPFPAGLNDCAAATRWVSQNKSELGISHIVISGESGGGNLSIATTLKAHQEGWSDEIAGVFAMCPYICGAYAQPPAELLSLSENDGYMLDCQMMGALVTVYDPEHKELNNPLAWPLQAEVSELAGLPPHVISVNELDPLRDEGLAFYRKLMQAGVPAVARTVHGTPHAGDVSFPDVTPDLMAETANALISFAQRVHAD